jgi:hypothetical protein
MPSAGDNVAEKLVGGKNAGQFFDGEFAAHLERKVRGSLPQEKADARKRQIAIARELAAEGSVTSNVTGQKMGTIDARIYHRFNQEFPGCWRDPEFVHAFFTDNPQCRSRGWKPKQLATRRGVTFVNGEAISPHTALHLR